MYVVMRSFRLLSNVELDFKGQYTLKCASFYSVIPPCAALELWYRQIIKDVSNTFNTSLETGFIID